MKRKIKKKKHIDIKIILLIMTFCIFLMGIFVYFKKQHVLKIRIEYQQALKEKITKHYNKYVITNTNANIYTFSNNEYILAGTISSGETIELSPLEITYESIYFNIANFEGEFYIKYEDVDPTEELKNYSNRYKKYIVFNQNIVTNDNVEFYDIDDNLIYKIDKSFHFPIIIKGKDKYGIEYNNRLLFIKKDDTKEIIDHHNTNEKNTSSIAVLNYHFFYDASSKEDSQKCNQIICLSTDNLKKHLDYIKENNFFTPTMKELEMYIDSMINLPKSVVLTIDDGWRADIGSNIIASYELNATVFLISKDYDKNAYKNEFIEVHSHGDNLHNPGVCPKGQGGAIQCLDKNTLLADLRTSSKKLDNTTVFCYPFYEYNNYSIEVLKEAGYTMAFGGPNEGGHSKVSPGIDKYRLPRYVVYINTTTNNIKSYIN